MSQKPIKGAQGQIGTSALDEQEIPILLFHHVPPVDALHLSPECRCVVDMPYVGKEFANSAK